MHQMRGDEQRKCPKYPPQHVTISTAHDTKTYFNSISAQQTFDAPPTGLMPFGDSDLLPMV